MSTHYISSVALTSFLGERQSRGFGIRVNVRMLSFTGASGWKLRTEKVAQKSRDPSPTHHDDLGTSPPKLSEDPQEDMGSESVLY